MASTGRRMACAKWRADSVSSFRSFLVLRLGVNRSDDGEGQLGLPVENGDFLLLAVFENLEVFLFSEPTGAPLVSVSQSRRYLPA